MENIQTVTCQIRYKLDLSQLRPREIVADGGFRLGPTREAFPALNQIPSSWLRN